MAEYQVTIAYGNLDQPQNSRQTISIDADSEPVAIELAKNKFISSNAAYRNKEVNVVKIK